MKKILFLVIMLMASFSYSGSRFVSPSGNNSNDGCDNVGTKKIKVTFSSGVPTYQNTLTEGDFSSLAPASTWYIAISSDGWAHHALYKGISKLSSDQLNMSTFVDGSIIPSGVSVDTSSGPYLSIQKALKVLTADTTNTIYLSGNNKIGNCSSNEGLFGSIFK